MYQVAPGYVSFLVNGISFAVRGRGVSAETLRRDLQSVDNGVPMTAVRTMNAVLDGSLAPRRFNLRLLGLFAVASMLLARDDRG